jgi:hypothetical protein
MTMIGSDDREKTQILCDMILECRIGRFEGLKKAKCGQKQL